VTFVIGGMTGVLLAVPPADFVLHNSLFLVAHFHNVIIGGVLFGAFAGYSFWFPKAFGFRLHEGLGKAAFWCWIIGFYLAFMPLYVLGLMGMTRRMQHYDVAQWRPWLLIAAGGAAVILAGIILQIAQLAVSIRRRDELRDATGDPWNGRSLEWATASPPPAFNFAILPVVEGEEAYWGIKQEARHQAAPAEQPVDAKNAEAASQEPVYEDIEMPTNSPTGFICAFFATFLGFALIWHIWWLAGSAAVGAYATFVVFAWRDRVEYIIPADTVAQIDRANRRTRNQMFARLRTAP
jgi:cytochrome o ubiquinol oxidase subunit I